MSLLWEEPLEETRINTELKLKNDRYHDFSRSINFELNFEKHRIVRELFELFEQHRERPEHFFKWNLKKENEISSNFFL